MKKIMTFVFSIGVGLVLPISLSSGFVVDAAVPNSHAEFTLEVPENTVCHKIDYSNDSHRILPDGRTTINDNPYDENTNPLYDLCIGSFPKYPSTSVEEGIFPFYYAKYTFIAEPMPVYEIMVKDEVTSNGKKLKVPGIDQTFDMDESIEASHLPSDEEIFLFYPYDNKHSEATKLGDALKEELKGPYQAGYNSFYHNIYRARYFASEVLFEFEIEEPKAEGKNQEKVKLFAGHIYYKLEEKCFRKDFLDYKEDCRDIEFFFPKSENISGNNKTYNEDYRGILEDSISVGKNGNEKSANVIPKKRLHYKNPGTHTLKVTVEENLQLRFQKDLGTEYQTVGNQSNNQGSNDPLKATNGIVYFDRKDTNNILQTVPKRLYSEQIKSGFDLKTIVGDSNIATDSGKTITTRDAKGHWYYDMEGNTDFLNYCDKDTGVWSGVNTDYKEGNTTETDRKAQKDVSCVHNEGRDYRFWQYDWSVVQWYPENPWDNKWGF